MRGSHRGESAPRPTASAARGDRTDSSAPGRQRVQLADARKEIQMNSSSNVFVLGVTGQVGKLVAKNLKRSEANFSVGTRRKGCLEELADQFGSSRFINLDDPRTFDEALKNITSIFLVTGYTVDMLVQSKSLIDAAKRNGINHIVHLGAFTRDHDAYSTVFAWHQMKHIFATAASRGRIYILTCLCRVFCQYGRSKVEYIMHTLPKPLGLLLWRT
jgi:hypothetical protein